MPTLITGATGLLGSNLVHLLGQRGEPVRLLIRKGSDRRGIREVHHQEVRGDINDIGTLRDALKGVDRVYHLAGLVRFDRASTPDLHRVNVEGVKNVLQAAREAGVRRVVHVSSVAAIGHGLRDAPANEDTPYNFEGSSPYHATKREGEQVALAAAAPGFDVVVANPGLVFGAYDVKPSSGRLLLAVARGLVRVYPAGGNSFASASDVAAGLEGCMEKGRSGERYILGGENLTYRELLTIAAEEAGVAPPILPAPESLLRLGGRLGDALGVFSPELAQLNSAIVDGMMRPAYVSSAKATRELGYQPRGIRPGIRAALGWFQEEGALPRDHGLSPRGVVA